MSLLLGFFTFNFIAPYQKENTYDLHGSLLDNVPCTMLIYTRSISFAQFCKFWVLCDHWGGKQGLLIYLLVVLVVEWGLFPFHGKNGNTKTPLKIPDSCAQAVHSFFCFCWWISFFVRRLATPRISKHWNHLYCNAFILLSCSIFTNDLALLQQSRELEMMENKIELA